MQMLKQNGADSLLAFVLFVVLILVIVYYEQRIGGLEQTIYNQQQAMDQLSACPDGASK